MSASGACTKLSKRLKLGGLETGSFRNGKAKTRRSLYGVYWAGSRQFGSSQNFRKTAVPLTTAQLRNIPLNKRNYDLFLQDMQLFRDLLFQERGAF